MISSLLNETCEVAREENVGDKVTKYSCNDYAYKTRHHETVVEEIFSYNRRSGSVEVDSSDIGRIIRNEEVSIDTRKDSEE